MKSTAEILGSFLRGVRYLTGATSASVYVRKPSDGNVEAILITNGPGQRVAEFRSLETATEQIDKLSTHGTITGFARPSSSGSGWLVPLCDPPSARVTAPSKVTSSPRRRRADQASGRRVYGWLGLSYEGDPDPPGPPPAGGESSPLWLWMAEFGASLAQQAIRVDSTLRDPVTGLADRIAFQALLSDHIDRVRDDRSWLSLVLINPHSFGQINERFGRAAGDQVIRELADLVSATLRDSDPISRYGGAIFGALLPATTTTDAERVSQKLVDAVRGTTFLDSRVRLELCCGIASYDPKQASPPEPLDLLRRADHALNLARRRGEGAIERWQESSTSNNRQEVARISEIFSGDLARDYRNMALLRDTVDMVAKTRDLDTLAAAVVERLYSACKADRVGLFRRNPEGRPELVRGVARPPSPVGARRTHFKLGEQSLDLLVEAMSSAEIRNGVVSKPHDGQQLAFAVPLVAAGEALGALYVDGAVESVDIDATDLIFFKALASQLSIALERAQLTQAEHDRGTVKLEAELKELRDAVKESKLIYSSQVMNELMTTVRRVGPTEATILISGESGTGKELIARGLHQLSSRSRRGLTVVDCGAIAPTLIDSELFGHDRGAYTGAQRRRSGRLAEADGGTVLLDEIGELPLEVQSRLLRFVQEKQITLVGESRSRHIDVRILAATNRDLEEEARAGRFRSDLYHRLNVVRLTVPPLRDRPEDAEQLAKHFLALFSTQYGKVGACFAAGTVDSILAYPWPGNVRELQNRILQAVILLEDREIDATALGLPSKHTELQRRKPPGPQQRRGASTQEALLDLRAALRVRIKAAADGDRGLQLPLGKWIGEDLLIEADRAEAGIARRAARRIGLAETTFRRRLNQATELERADLSPRSKGWSIVREALTTLLHAQDRSGQPLMQLAESTLIDEIQELLPNDEVMGAALLGVTLPTYRRRVRNLKASASATVPQKPIARSRAS